MNCEAWGSSGWKLLHSLALHFDNNEDANHKMTKKFFISIKHLLPCIYCRRSYAQYIQELPIDPFLKEHRLSEWIYHIHNKVNDKLRNQGYTIKKNPSFRNVIRDISTFVARHKKFIGWQFIYCIAFNYPVMKDDLSKVRYDGHLTFFKSFEHIINDKKCIAFLEKYPIEKALVSRDTFTKWVYSLEKYVKNGKCCTYDTKCRMFEKHRVEKCKDGTCRIK